MTVASIAAKATRLHTQDRVMELPDARVFRVLGDHDTYTVTLSGSGESAWCACPATGVCSHMAAALLEAGLV